MKKNIFKIIIAMCFLTVLFFCGCSTCPMEGSKALIKKRLCVNTCNPGDKCGEICEQRIEDKDAQIEDLKHRLAEETLLVKWWGKKIDFLEMGTFLLETEIEKKDRQIKLYEEKIDELMAAPCD